MTIENASISEVPQVLPQTLSTEQLISQQNFGGTLPKSVLEVPAVFGEAPRITGLPAGDDYDVLDPDDPDYAQDVWEDRMYGPEPV